jgi:DNA repair photolyase
MEPRAARSERRLEGIARLKRGGDPTGVMMAPIIPGLNDPNFGSELGPP